ncbi:MAG: S-layer homology domain-containing protein [Clostridia bacterium]|nr:S-layer homology domain-containing protein [Clostridia bacterium]
MKKALALFLALFLCCSTVSAQSPDLAAAKTLYDLGLLKGSKDEFSADAMELNRTATRAELSVTVTRMLGKDEKARYQQNAHPFTDVPAWASDYVGWLYENYLVNGNSDTYFGAEETASVQQFCAMMLRVLGYSDADGDFDYATAKTYALSIGLIDSSILEKTDLYRSDMVQICVNALNLPLKNANRLLSTKLMDERVFSSEAAARAGLGERQSPLAAFFASVDQNLPKARVSSHAGNRITLAFNEDLEEYGVRVFYTSADSPTVTEAPVKKGKIHYYPNGAAGYMTTLTVTIPGEDIELIVVKTSSEGALYNVLGKSNIVKL